MLTGGEKGYSPLAQWGSQGNKNLKKLVILHHNQEQKIPFLHLFSSGSQPEKKKYGATHNGGTPPTLVKQKCPEAHFLNGFYILSTQQH